MVKNLFEMQETQVWSLGWEDLLEKGMATHSGSLAWKSPWTGEPGRLQSTGLQRVRHDWAVFTCRPRSVTRITNIFSTKFLHCVCGGPSRQMPCVWAMLLINHTLCVPKGLNLWHRADPALVSLALWEDSLQVGRKVSASGTVSPPTPPQPRVSHMSCLCVCVSSVVANSLQPQWQ